MTDTAPLGEVGDGVRRLLTRLWSVGGAEDGPLVELGGTQTAGRRVVDAYVAVPSAADPRFLVPDVPGRRSARLLTAYRGLRDGPSRRRRTAVSFAARLGVLGRVAGTRIRVTVPTDMPADRAQEEVFTEQLRHRLDAPGAIAAFGIPSGHPDHHPTAQLFLADGRPLGFAKVGWSPASAPLVEAEARALVEWHGSADADATVVHAPDVLAVERWGDAPYLVTAPLPEDVVAVPDDDPQEAAARAIAGAGTVRPLRGSPWWEHVHERLDRTEGTAEPHLHAAATRGLATLSSVADDPWVLARWHGDWCSWNVATNDAGLHVWDWEHSSTCAPWGFDVLNWRTTVAHQRGGLTYPEAVDLARHAHVPRNADVAPDALLLAYLVEVATRRCGLPRDRSAPDGPLYAGLHQVVEGVARDLGGNGSA